MRRKTFLAASTVAIGSAACTGRPADAFEIVEPAGQFDYAAFKRAVSKSADIRHVWDVGGNPPAALSAIKNAFNGYQFGYGIKPGRIAMAACLHNAGNFAGYDDQAWSRYNLGGQLGLKDASGNAINTNVFARARSAASAHADPNDENGMYQDPTLQALQRRGLVVLLCHTGAAEQARLLVKNGNAPSGETEDQTLRYLLAHVVPGVIVVPSAVATLGLLQNRFNYAYTAVTL